MTEQAQQAVDQVTEATGVDVQADQAAELTEQGTAIGQEAAEQGTEAAQGLADQANDAVGNLTEKAQDFLSNFTDKLKLTKDPSGFRRVFRSFP